MRKSISTNSTQSQSNTSSQSSENSAQLTSNASSQTSENSAAIPSSTSSQTQESGKSADALIREADALPIQTKFKKKLSLYQQARESGSALALIKLGDLYRQLFALQSDGVKEYIQINKVTDLNTLHKTLTNNLQSLQFYILAWKEVENENAALKQKIHDLAYAGVKTLFSDIRACHEGFLLIFLDQLTNEQQMILINQFKINLFGFRHSMIRSRDAFFTPEKIVRTDHIQSHGFSNTTLALIGSRFLITLVGVNITNYNDAKTNQNLIEIGSFFLTCLINRIENRSEGLKITDTTAEAFGKFFICHKDRIIKKLPIDTYELCKAKTHFQHGKFILEKITSMFWQEPAHMLTILHNVLAVPEFNRQNRADPKLLPGDLKETINQFLKLIKVCEDHNQATDAAAAATATATATATAKK